MGIDWEEILGADGDQLDDAYDEAASDALYQDHPTFVPPDPSIDPDDDDESQPLPSEDSQ